MLKRTYFCGGSILAATMMLGLAQTADAAEAATTPTTVEEVVVTGSFIAGTPEDAALPVDVIGAEDLKKQGSPSTVNLVKTITAAQSSMGESNRFLGTAAGAATVNLRGFGSSRTLVLFNGHRMAVQFNGSDYLIGLSYPVNPDGHGVDFFTILPSEEIARDLAASVTTSVVTGPPMGKLAAR